MKNRAFQDVLNGRLSWFKDKTAIHYRGKSVSYAQLDEKSDYVANFIVNKGIKKGTFIGMFIDNRVDFIFTLIGILKAGCVFVPLDSSIPPHRLSRMVQSTDIGYLIADRHHFNQFSNSSSQLYPVARGAVCLLVDDLLGEGQPGEFLQKPAVNCHPGDKIYIYFTSGTTGMPKAILGKNKSLLHFINWELETFQLGEGIRGSQLIAPVFDAFLRDLFVPLFAGGTVCIPDTPDITTDAAQLIKWVDQAGIHLIHCVPGVFRLLNAPYLKNSIHFKDLRLVLLSGDKIIPEELVNWYDMFDRRIRLVNLYGPTETTMIKTYYCIDKTDVNRDTIPIGKPMKGARVIIFDEDMDFCDEYEIGELHIRTPYLTFGYYNNPGLNREAFIRNPLSDNTDDIMYKTGDLGRWLPDGNIELVGRRDRQVKIRGIRVELEEVERALMKIPFVEEAAVVKKELTNNNEALWAYVTAVEKDLPDRQAFYQAIKNHLSEILPVYMVPTIFTLLQQFPRLPNGKVDYQSLPKPLQEEETSAGKVMTPMQQKLSGLWTEILGRNRFGLHQNFFELGGNSLNVMSLLGKIHREFDVRISLGEIFENATIEKQATLITEMNKELYFSIHPTELKEYYPLTSSQKRLYFLQQMEKSNTVYNVPIVIRLEGKLEKKRLEKTFRQMIRRHESLRTSFLMIHDDPVQKVHKRVKFQVQYTEPAESGWGMGNGDEGLRSSDFVYPFALEKVPLIRVKVLRENSESSLMIIDMHHIITDGVSQVVLTREFTRLYSGMQLPGFKLQYRDFAQWQNTSDQEAVVREQEAYWLDTFRGELPLLELPLDFPRPRVQDFSGKVFRFHLGEKQTAALNRLAIDEGCTLFMVITALYNILLSKLSGQEEIIVGTPVAGRRHADLEPIVGIFVNTLALRNFPLGHQSFQDFLQQVKTRVLQAFENQDYPLEDLVDKVVVEREISRNPLFDTMLALQNMEDKTDPPASISFPGLRTSVYQFEDEITRFDLALTGIELEQELEFLCHYSVKLFTGKTIQRFIDYFTAITSIVLQEPQVLIAQIQVMGQEERERLLWELNDTARDCPMHMTIPQLYEAEAHQYPDKLAVVYVEKPSAPAKEQITYSQLEKNAGQLAARLQARGMGPGTIVGIMAERSIEMVIAVLAILKAGAAYLPIDPDYPRERIDLMLKDSGTNWLVTDRDLSKQIKLTKEIIDIPDAIDQVSTPPPLSFHPSQPSSLAYVIYTSGSTGKPKGVMIQHRSVVRLVKNPGFIDLLPEDRLLLTGALVFDITTFEIWGSLLNGLSLYLADDQLIFDGSQLARVVHQHKISVLHLIPPVFDRLAPCFPEIFTRLRYLLVGGDRVYPNQVNRIRKRYKDLTILHMYGPTENTTFSTYFEVDRDYEITIPLGRPIGNSTVYILDKILQPQPIGIMGELWVGGDGVARGYLNNPELTAERFHRSYMSYMSYIYRTGDLVRWMPEGIIEFLGRMDHQVKIRGIRVELAEIESILLSHEMVKEALVIAEKGENRETYLCAYVVPYPTGTEQAPEMSSLREYLEKRLPRYMIPGYFMVLERLPLNPNKKIDRSALPDPGKTGASDVETYTAPFTVVEKKLVEIWETVLGKEKIGIYDNFFMMGGDSIMTIQVASRMNSAGYKVEIQDIFHYQTIARLAPHVKSLESSADQSAIIGEIPLTPVQAAFFQGSPIAPHHNNQALMLFTQKDLSLDAVKAIFTKIQEHHDALRIIFPKEAGNPVQFNRDSDLPLSIEEFDLRNLDIEEALSFIEAKSNDIQAGIQLETGPLMKLGLFRLVDGHRLLIVIHHLVMDGVSWRILLEDIETLYGQYCLGESLVLPLKTDSFQVWAERLRGFADSKIFLKEKEYWHRLESQEVQPLQKDFSDGDNTWKQLERLSTQLSESDTGHLLTDAHRAFGTEINDLLLTALGLGLQQQFGNKLQLVALEGHGREPLFEDIDISRTVGWFTSVYPVLLHMSCSHDLARQIKEIKEMLHRVPYNGIGYGVLRYLTSPQYKQDIHFHLAPRVSFNYLGQFDADVRDRGFVVASDPVGHNHCSEARRDYEIDITAVVAHKRLNISVDFSSKQYKKTTIKAFLEGFKTQLRRLIAFCSHRKKQELTPVDLTYHQLSLQELHAVEAIVNHPIEDICILTPMQEGMLFHSLIHLNSPTYFEQMSYQVNGELDVEAVKGSLNILVQRHAALRTAFIHEGLNRPVQVVLKDREIDFIYRDISGTVPPMERKAYCDNIKKKDRQKLFHLATDPLMRVTVIRVRDNEYQLIWSNHHILMDGWCLAILFSEYFEIYNSILENRSYSLPPVKPYRNYLQWLESQDQEVLEKYWQTYLEGYTTAVEIPGKRRVESHEDGVEQKAHISVFLEEKKTRGLEQLAIDNHVTLSTLLQTLWAILLAKHAGINDVVFGVVVSGRPPEVEGVDSMVGLFINAVPARIRFDRNISFNLLAQQVQEAAVEREKFHHYPLHRIQSRHILKQDLLDHILIYENFPVTPPAEMTDNSNNTNGSQLIFSGFEVFEHTSYDFNVGIFPGERLEIRFEYTVCKYDAAVLHLLGQRYTRLIEQVMENPGISVSQLAILSAEEEQHETYWLKQFEQQPPVIRLPIDYERVEPVPFRADSVSFQVDEKQTAALEKMANGFPLDDVLLAIFIVLLSKFSGQDDIIVGTVTPAEKYPLAFRNYPSGHKTFKEFLAEVVKRRFDAYAHRCYPLTELAHRLQWEKHPGGNPLFRLRFCMENNDSEAPFDIKLSARQQQDKLHMDLYYNSACFNKNTAELMADSFLVVVRHILENGETKIKDLEHRTPIQRELGQVQKLEFNFN